MRALLVGVGEASRHVVAGVLGSRGHEHAVAASGVEGLDRMEREAPALVIVEGPLPDMDSATFCRQARASVAGADAVILVISGSESELPAVLDAGATDLYPTTSGPAALATRVLIAERLVAQHARLRDRELRFRRLFESGLAGVTVSDFDGNFKEANDAFLHMLGYTREDLEVASMSWETITPLDQLVVDVEARAQLRATGFLPLRERAFVHKDGRHIAVLVGSAQLAGTSDCISYVTDVTERKEAAEVLRASERQYRALFDQSPFPKFLFDDDTCRILAVNDAAMATYGYTREELLGSRLDAIGPVADGTRAVGEHGATRPQLRRHRKKDGTPLDVEVTVHTFSLGSRPCGLAVALDVTDRNRMERQLSQTQKMDALGSLASGVAHDFNNLLSIILSYGEIVAEGMAEGDPVRADVDEIVGAANRASDLTRQLLAFSRQQLLAPRVIDLNEILEGVGRILHRVVGEQIELCIVKAPLLGAVKADPGQIEQVLMNLVVNARDAMERGGKVTVETSNVDIEVSLATADAHVERGNYVVIAVTDTGSGMDAKTRARIFDPFFTTKAEGKGTGLGLSMVFGIVQQTGGSISVDSEPGVGTTVRVYLPRTDAACSPPVVAADVEPLRLGTETILLVEDDKAVRVMTRVLLERGGYKVLEADSGGDALLLCEQHPGKIDLLLTDVVMPRLNGRLLADRLAPLRPQMSVLFMSGHSDDVVARQGSIEGLAHFLQKPITPHGLLRKVRDVLDADARERPRRRSRAERAADSGSMVVPGRRMSGTWPLRPRESIALLRGASTRDPRKR